jgi:hypothetical protein
MTFFMDRQDNYLPGSFIDSSSDRIEVAAFTLAVESRNCKTRLESGCFRSKKPFGSAGKRTSVCRGLGSRSHLTERQRAAAKSHAIFPKRSDGVSVSGSREFSFYADLIPARREGEN